MDKESIEFHFTQSKNDTSVLTAVASQIYNPLRVIIWCVFACGLFLCMLLTLSEENARYTAPNFDPFVPPYGGCFQYAGHHFLHSSKASKMYTK